MELTYMYIVILLCVLDATLGIQTYDIKRRNVQDTSQSECSVTSALLDILKNDLKRLEDRYDDLVKRLGDEQTRLEGRYDDLVKRFGDEQTRLEGRYDDQLKRLGDEQTRLEVRFDDQLKRLGDEQTRLEDRYDDLVDKYSKLLQMTTDLQEKFANFTAEKPGASVRDCADLYKDGETLNGVYTITPDDSRSPFNVYCDMTTDGGGWTVFQKREDGSVDFYRPWDDYKQGFGEMGGEHWLGLENMFTITWLKRFRLRVEREDSDGAWRRKEQIHTITNQSRYELRVDMKDANGVWRYARYDNFAIASEKDNYKLTVGAYSGNAGNSLGPLNGQPFSTKDRDNDASPGNCAQKLKGAWWYKSCHASNLNGLYHLGDRSSSADGVNWGAFRGHKHSLKTTEMKLRPVGFKSGPVSSG